MRTIKPRNIYVAALILISAILSAYIAYNSYQGGTACFGGTDCNIVQNSSYGSLFGIKVSLLGATALSILFLSYILSYSDYPRYKIYYFLSLLSALCSLGFISIQAFILHAWCSSCLVVDLLIILIFIFSTIEYARLRKYY